MSIEIKPMTSRLREVNITEWTDSARAFVRDLNVMDRMAVGDLIDRFFDTAGKYSVEERAEAGLNACIIVLADGEGNQLLDPLQLDDLKKASFEPVSRVMQLLLDSKAKDDSLKKG